MTDLQYFIGQSVFVCIILIPSLFFGQINGNQKIQIKGELLGIMEDPLKEKIVAQLDTLFSQMGKSNIDDRLIKAEKRDLTKAVLMRLQGIKSVTNSSENFEHYSKQLIKFHPISENTYSISIALIHNGASIESPYLETIFRFIAAKKNEKIHFSIPLEHLTKNWKSSTVGNITYYYKDTIRMDRAEVFNRKNNIISRKLNVPTEQFKFYMCRDYQEILNLLGYEYQLESATTTRLGYGVEKGHIFSIMNNEDFSHDVFHHYSEQINKNSNRNWIAEEGIACSWGNAYYTDENGEMIGLNHLIQELKIYVGTNKNASLLNMFKNNIKIYDHIAPELSVRSVISGVLCNEIERELGIMGILEIINCGRIPNSTNAYLSMLNNLIGINESNFNAKVALFLKNY